MDEFPFWSFSLELYGRPGVAPACLALQDRFGCDVNLALFSLWAARCGKALGADEFERLDAAVKPWRTRIVEPIRSLRRSLKTESLGFRQSPPKLVARNYWMRSLRRNRARNGFWCKRFG